MNPSSDNEGGLDSQVRGRKQNRVGLYLIDEAAQRYVRKSAVDRGVRLVECGL